MMSKKKKSLPTTPFEGEITKLSHEGRGITYLDGKPVFVEGGLLGEKVTYQITKIRRQVREAKILSWQTRAKERVEPLCAHANICGGCSLQHISAEQQIKMKEATLFQQLKQFGGVESKERLAPVVANPWGYRRKARLAVKYVIKKEKLLVGFREKSSAYLADIESCEVLVPEINQLLKPLATLIASLSVYQSIPQVEVAAGDSQVALVFRHLMPFSDADLDALVSFSKTTGAEIYLQPGNMDSIHKLAPDDGQAFLTYSLPKQGITYQFKATDFIQVNRQINEKLIEEVLSHAELKPTDKVLDLFCGLGNLTLPMAKFAKSCVGVEFESSLTERALQNASANHLENVIFYSFDLTKNPSDEPWFNQTYHKCVIDPARPGAKEIIEALPPQSFEKIIYVSCNPATLARDAGILVSKGYELTSAGVLDMFPHTQHVESIAVFNRTK